MESDIAISRPAVSDVLDEKTSVADEGLTSNEGSQLAPRSTQPQPSSALPSLLAGGITSRGTTPKNAPISCFNCRDKKKKCEVGVGGGACKRCVSLSLQCVFDTKDDGRRKPASGITRLDLRQETYVDRFFRAQTFKIEVVPPQAFRESVAFYTGASTGIDSGGGASKTPVVLPPPGWSAEPLSKRNPPAGLKALLNAVLAIGAALCGNPKDAQHYHSAAQEAIKDVDLATATPSPPLVSAVLALGYLAQGFSQDRAKSSFLYSTAADMAARCPHLSASVELNALLVADKLKGAPSVTGSSSGGSSLAASSPGDGLGSTSSSTMPQADMDLVRKAMAVGFSVVFLGETTSLALFDSISVRFQSVATKHGIAPWLPVTLFVSMLRVVAGARTRTATADDVSAAQMMLEQPFTGPQQTLLIFAVVAQLVIALHGPVLETCGCEGKLMPDDQDDEVDKQADHHEYGTDKDLGVGLGVPAVPALSSFSSSSSTGSVARGISNMSSSSTTSTSVGSRNNAPCPSVSSAASRTNPFAPLLLLASRRLLEMLQPISLTPPSDDAGSSVSSPVARQNVSSALSSSSSSSSLPSASPTSSSLPPSSSLPRAFPRLQPTLPPGILPWHLLIMDGLRTNDAGVHCLPLSGPSERAVFESSYLGQAEGLFRAAIKAALCSVAYLGPPTVRITGNPTKRTASAAFSSLATSLGAGPADSPVVDTTDLDQLVAAGERVLSLCASVESIAATRLTSETPRTSASALPSSSSASSSATAGSGGLLSGGVVGLAGLPMPMPMPMPIHSTNAFAAPAFPSLPPMAYQHAGPLPHGQQLRLPFPSGGDLH